MRYVGALSHGCDVRRMVAQEGAPALRGRVTFLGHIFPALRPADIGLPPGKWHHTCFSDGLKRS
jgi:hypothetical protein